MSERSSSLRILPWRFVEFLLVLAASAVASAQPSAPEPLTLRQAAERALARAPQIAVSRAEEAETGAEARLARDASHPEAWLTTTPGYSSGLPVAVAGRAPAVAGVEIRQSLYDPARLAEALESAARGEIARGARETSTRRTLESVLTAYARCWANAKVVSAVKERERWFEAAVARQIALRGEERATDLEVERARLQLAKGRQRRLDLESEQDLNQLELLRLTGWPANTALVLAEDPLAALPPATPADDLAAARAADPELLSLASAIDALDGSARIRERKFAPVVDAEAQYARLSRANGYDQFYRKFKADDWIVGISVAIPLWTGGRLVDAASKTSASRDRLVARRRLREEEIETLVRRLERDVALAGAGLAVARQAEGVGEEEVRVARALSEEGRGDPGDVGEKEAGLMEAREQAAQASVEVFTARVRLLALRGEIPGALQNSGHATSDKPPAELQSPSRPMPHSLRKYET